MQCPLCKGDMRNGKTILPFDFNNDRVVIVLNVPAMICEECGDEFIDISVTRNVEILVDKANADGIKMGFVEYNRTAA